MENTWETHPEAAFPGSCTAVFISVPTLLDLDLLKGSPNKNTQGGCSIGKIEHNLKQPQQNEFEHMSCFCLSWRLPCRGEFMIRKPPSTFELLHHFRWLPMFTRAWYVPCNMQSMLTQWTVAQTHYPNHPRMTLVQEYTTKFP